VSILEEVALRQIGIVGGERLLGLRVAELASAHREGLEGRAR
jgi:hypothetical protein